MNITYKDIEAFVMQYPDLPCIKVMGQEELFTPQHWIRLHNWSYDLFGYIELRHSSTITDEEADLIEYIDGSCAHIAIMRNDLNREEAEYFRSLGIAIQYKELTLQRMVQQGILKLKYR